MPSSRVEQRFQDILDSISDIESFTDGLSKAAFQADKKSRLAVERSISIISEAAVKLGEEAAVLAPDIPWHDIRGIGNVIRHSYDAVSFDVVWNIIEDDLPPLKRACSTVLQQFLR